MDGLILCFDIFLMFLNGLIDDLMLACDLSELRVR